MTTLYLRYDLDSRSIIAGHVDGRWLNGLASVTLGPGAVKLTDKHGRDLLNDPSTDSDSSPVRSKAASDIAEAFGADGSGS